MTEAEWLLRKSGYGYFTRRMGGGVNSLRMRTISVNHGKLAGTTPLGVLWNKYSKQYTKYTAKARFDTDCRIEDKNRARKALTSRTDTGVTCRFEL